MGCAPSSPQDVDILPIKPQCRTAFARCSTTDRALLNGQPSDTQLGQQPDADGHDVVLCYPMGGTVFGLELQARYENMDSVSLWTPEHFQSTPSTPLHTMKSMSGGPRGGSGLSPALASASAPGPEIKPVPEEAGDGPSLPNQRLSREIRLCRKGVVVLVTAGCTWDDGVLTCLRLTGRFLRPLVMVHCIQSCPLPSLEEWPPDVRPLIAASGPPVKYLAQHSAEALHHVEQRMIEAAQTAAANAAAAATAGNPSSATTAAAGVAVAQATLLQPGSVAPAPVAVRNGNCGCAPERRPQIVLSLQPPGTLGSQEQGKLKQAQSQEQLPQVPQVTAGSASAAAGAEGPAPRPLSLAALQALDSDLCRRAAQLMAPWATGSRGSSATGRSSTPSMSRSDSPITTTLVEPIVSSSAPESRPTLAARCPSGGGAAAVTRLSHLSCGSSKLPNTEGSLRRGQQKQQQQHGRAQGASGQEVSRTTSGGGSATARQGPMQCGCLLRFRDCHWAPVCAFICAHLELDFGQGNVGMQGAALPGASMAPPSPAVTVSVPAVTVSAAASSGQFLPAGALHPGRQVGGTARDSWGQQSNSHGQSQQHQQQQQQQPRNAQAGGVISHPSQPQSHQHHHHHHKHKRTDAAVPLDVAIAAAGTFVPLSARGSSRGSSSRCSTGSVDCGSGSVVAANGGSGNGGRADILSSMSTSAGSPGTASSRHCRASTEDELLAFAAPPALSDDCNDAMHAEAVPGAGAAPAAAVAGPRSSGAGMVARMSLRTHSWAGAALEPAAAGATAAAGSEPNSLLVYFVSPGLSAPLACLEEISSARARGRRVQLVADGGFCQRLPDYAPAGLTQESWKAVKKLWHGRLLYVPDYHSAFCTLLKQEILAAAAPQR